MSGPPAVGPAANVDECLEHRAVCTAAGQDCLDSSGAAGDWVCYCPTLTFVKAPRAPAVCVLDECAFGEFGFTVCERGEQDCHDVDTDVAARHDWECRCRSPTVGVQRTGVADCEFDECTGESCGHVTLDQRFDASIQGVASKPVGTEEQCAGFCAQTDGCNHHYFYTEAPNSGYPYAGTCTLGEPCCYLTEKPMVRLPEHGGPVVAGCPHRTCETNHQRCQDPNTHPASVNDWECVCVAPSVGAAVVAPAVCIYDECIAGGGTICPEYNQSCYDPDRSEQTTGDWTCSCPAGSTGVVTAGLSWCEIDECEEACPTCANGTCADAGQECEDPHPSVHDLHDWMCRCPLLRAATATAAAAVCTGGGGVTSQPAKFAAGDEGATGPQGYSGAAGSAAGAVAPSLFLVLVLALAACAAHQ